MDHLLQNRDSAKEQAPQTPAMLSKCTTLSPPPFGFSDSASNDLENAGKETAVETVEDLNSTTAPGTSGVDGSPNNGHGESAQLDDTAKNRRRNPQQQRRQTQRQPTIDEVLEGQDWSQHSLGRATFSEEDGVRSAIRQNHAIGFATRTLKLIREILGLTPMPPIIDRRFVLAVRDYQTRQGIADVTHGVIGDATMAAFNLAAIRRFRERRRTAQTWYRQNAYWKRCPETEFDARRLRLIAILGVGADDFVQEPQGRGFIVQASDQFIIAVINWQFANVPEESHHDGRITADVFSEMTGDTDSSSGYEEGEHAETLEDQGEHTEPLEDQGEHAETLEDQGEHTEPLEVQGEHAEFLDDILAEIGIYFDEVTRIRRARREGSSASRRAAIAAELVANDLRFAPVARDLDIAILKANLPNWDPGATSRNGRTIRNWFRTIRTKILEYLHGEMQAHPPGTNGEGYQPVRLDRQAALAELENDGIDFHSAPIDYVDWNERLTHYEGQSMPVPEVARLIIANMQRIATNAREIARGLEKSGSQDEKTVRAQLLRLNKRMYGSRIRGMRPNYSVIPDLPDTPTASLTAGQLQGAMSAWIRKLRALAFALDRQISRHRQYLGTVHRSNHGAIAVDLHRTGVTVCNQAGRPLNPNMMRLDPQFAVAMSRFLFRIRSYGITELWTNGSLRAPMSDHDSHSTGVAFDICGFKIGDGEPTVQNLMHLRSGYPGSPEDGDFRRGHSDWFDDSVSDGGARTHRDWMRGFVALMREFFGQILGPGFNDSHMAHFHVQLAGAGGHEREPIRVVDEDRNLSPSMLRTAERRSPGWRAAHGVAESE